MGPTLDNILTVFRVTIFHPVASLLFPGVIFLFQKCCLPIKVAPDFSGLDWISSSSVQMKTALVCVVFSWVLQWNRIMNRKALNPASKMSCNWPEEIVVVTGGSGGIGEELVKKLERLGATVAIMDVVPPTFKLGECRLMLHKTFIHPCKC
jgi:hypothetical protein